MSSNFAASPEPPPAGGLPRFPDDFESASVRGGERGDRMARTRAGRWWWVSSSGEVSVSRGIQGVDATVGPEPADTQAFRWGFDLLFPPWADAFVQRGARHVRDLHLMRAGDGGISEDGVSLPDVFDPRWEEAVGQVFNAVKPAPGLVGWVGDLNPRWGGWSEDDQPLPRPGLLQICLGLNPAKRAFHAAWEFVLARHGGELAGVARDWGLELASRGQVRELTRQEHVVDAPAYRRDLTDFVAEFSTRYFATLGDASSRVNADAILFGPLLGSATPRPVIDAAVRHCSVMLTSEAGISGGVAPELWWVDGWDSPELLTPLEPGQSNLEAVIRNGREWLCAGLRDPSVVGYIWSRFRAGDLAVDDPFSVGLVDENGRTNSLLAQPLQAINEAAVGIRSDPPA